MENDMDRSIMKALNDMDARVAKIIKSGGARSKAGAIAVVVGGSDPADRALWLAYQQAGARIAAAGGEQTFPKSEALVTLEREAQKLASRTGVSEVRAFAAIYGDPRYADLVAAEKAAFLDRAQTVVVARQAPARTAYEQLERERAAHVSKAIAASAADSRRGAPPTRLIIALEQALGCSRSRATEIAAQIQSGPPPAAVS